MNEHQERWAAVQAGTAQPASVAVRNQVSTNVATELRSALEYCRTGAHADENDDILRGILTDLLARAEALEALNEAAIDTMCLNACGLYGAIPDWNEPNKSAWAKLQAALRRVRGEK